MGEKRNAYRLLVGKRLLGRPKHRWDNNVEMECREIGWGDMDWIALALDEDKWRTLVNTVMTFRVP
jgi:hypothetical protein